MKKIAKYIDIMHRHDKLIQTYMAYAKNIKERRKYLVFSSLLLIFVKRRLVARGGLIE